MSLSFNIEAILMNKLNAYIKVLNYKTGAFRSN